MDKRLDKELNSELSEVHAILDALKSAGLITGFALAVELPDSGHSVEGCCAGHMAEMLDPELAMSTGHVGIVAAVAGRLITALGEPDVTSASPGLVTLMDMGFRESVPSPRETPSKPVKAAPKSHPYLGEKMECGHFSIHLSEGECLRCMEETRWSPLDPKVSYWGGYQVHMGPDMKPVMLKAPFTDTPATWSTAEAAMAWMHNNYPGADFDVVKGSQY